MLSVDNLYARYPFVGYFKSWPTDTGFGFIQLDPLEQLQVRLASKAVFAHITGNHFHKGSSQQALTNKRCLFSLGVTPFRYEQKKIDKIAVDWILEEDIIESLDSYYEDRQTAIKNWSFTELANTLRASWYTEYADLWTQKGYDFPVVKLELSLDKALQNKVRQRENNINNIHEWLNWLEVKETSPYYVNSEQQRKDIIITSLWALEQQSVEFFLPISGKFIDLLIQHKQDLFPNFINNILPLLAGEMTREDLSRLSKNFPQCSKLITSDLVNRTLTIDIESNGTKIIQIGWVHNRQKNLETDFDTPDKIVTCLEKIETSISERGIQWLIGHNLIDWDLPILRQYKSDFLDKCPIWDTLLMSWVLKPWCRTHALTTSENAHQADADAMATFKLFEQQLQHCSPRFRHSQFESPSDPIQLLYELREGIPRQREYSYPLLPSSITELSGFVIVPEWRLWTEFAWRYKVIHAYPNASILSPDRLEQDVQSNQENIWLMAIAIVVRDAAENHVQVTIEMLPLWLREKTEQILQNCLDTTFCWENYQNSNEYLFVSTYKAFKNDLSQLPEKAQLLYLAEGQLELLPDSQPLRDDNISQLSEQRLSRLSAHALFKIVDEQIIRQLTHHEEINHFNYWLEYNPVALRDSQQACWYLHHFWKQLPPLLINSQEDSNHPSIAIVPRWQDSGTAYNRLTENIIPPTSGNRLRYWEDTLSQLFALANHYPNNTIFVLLVANLSEARAISNVLATLGKTYQIKGSILRKLEKIYRKGKRFAVDTITNTHAWLEASEILGYHLQLVIESLPLNQWWICRSPDTKEILLADEASILNENELDIQYDDDDSDKSEGETDDLESETVITHFRETDKILPVTFSTYEILNCLKYFLELWLNTIIQGTKLDFLPIILDCRLERLKLERTHRLRQETITAILLTEAQESQLLSALENELGELERKKAPTDYESYRAFLEANWGYLDFKENTQKPALEAIIPNNKDVLVRLPTGEGKSVLFQVPALLRGQYTQKLTIVITPLRALMADQVKSLWHKGFLQSVDYLSCDREPWVIDEVYQGIVDNRIKLLFVAPERFRVKRFREALHRRHQIDRGFEYIVIDEAHCVSQWGFEFRPDYLYAMREIQRLYRDREASSFTQILMFSATVTEAVRKDLEREAGIVNNEEAYVISPAEISHPIQPFIDLNSKNVGTRLYGNTITSDRIDFIEQVIEEANSEISSVIVFVTRRTHAEELCQILNERQDTNVRVEYFHAGLSSDDRSERYEEFLAREIQVLICTKAFGMGMDIPHIHWCVHLAPPAYLEDYLQEVGRIGRDQESREQANSSQLQAKLLYFPDDFDTNHTKRQESRITIPKLIELWESIKSNSKSLAQIDTNICIIPVEQFGTLKENELRLYLFWLEYCERVVIQAYLPSLLQIKLNKVRLESIAQQDIESEQSIIAKVLLKLYQSSPTAEVRQINNLTSLSSFSPLDNLFNLAKEFLGFLFKNPEQNLPSFTQETIKNQWNEAEVSLDNLWQKSNLPTIDSVFSALNSLAKNNSIEFIRNIDFKEGRYKDIEQQMWNSLDRVLDNILVISNNFSRTITVEQASKWINVFEQQQPVTNLSEAKIKSAKKRAIRATIKLCNDSSLRIRETLNNKKEVIWNYSLPEERKKYIQRRIEDIKNIAKEIIQALTSQNSLNLNLTELLNCCQGSVSLRDLKAALRLLSNLGIYTNQKKLTTFSYILELQKTDDLQPPDSSNISESDRKMFSRLEQVNTMAELRSFAMELYAFLPDEMRKSYIDNYFAVDSSKKLEEFLEQTVSNIDEKILQQDSRLSGFLAKVRQDAIKNEKEHLSDEQITVCEYPYKQNLLVNAGPGAGKTHVLMMRCADLIYRQGLQPNEILVLAFNRAVVYEIKKRTRQLFTNLGYGSYVKQLQVYTFHSFALKYFNNGQSDNEDENSIENSLHHFAENLQQDNLFRKQVANGYRAILIDEFQDMNEDFYSVICSLQSASSAGVMVIGDDDQDILLWNRLEWQERFGSTRLHAREYFQDFQTEFNAECLYLTYNYRSTQTIVEHSQNEAIELIKNRLKSGITLAAFREQIGSVNELENNLNLDEEVRQSLEQGQNIAVLCRTNAEVSRVYEHFLELNFSSLKVQRTHNLRLAKIREIGEWLDICQNYLRHDEQAVLSPELFEKLLNRYQQIELADTTEGRYKIENLWQLTLDDNGSFSLLSQHTKFIKDLTISDFERILGQDTSHNEGITISTINKVKGLEFDVVFIPTSTASFPFNDYNVDLNDLAAEEARLYYVALTRAKNSLYRCWGDRERAWCETQIFRGSNNNIKFLEGTPDEVFISWSGLSYQYQSGLQNYIKTQVRVDNLLIVQDKSVYHNGIRIAHLQKQLSGGNNSCIRVSNVYRYPIVEERIRPEYPCIWNNIAPELKTQGWCYTVLLTGRL